MIPPIGAFGAAAAPATGGLSALVTAAPFIASLFGGLFGGGKSDVPREQRELMTSQKQLTDVEAALQRLLLQRKQAQDPMWRALQMMAFNRLPTFAKSGFDMSAMQNPVGGPRQLPPGTRERPVGTQIVDTAVPRF